MDKKKMICFDLDGTLVNLYGVPDWLPKLRAEDPSPYEDAEPLVDMNKLSEILRLLQQAGFEIAVITWLSKNSSEDYKAAVREAKRAWLQKYGFVYDHFHGVQYGATKADSVREKASAAILIDDNDKVRKGWHLGPAIDPNETDVIEWLKNLL